MISVRFLAVLWLLAIARTLVVAMLALWRRYLTMLKSSSLWRTIALVSLIVAVLRL